MSDFKAEDAATEDTKTESAQTDDIADEILDTMSGGHGPPPTVD